MKLTKLFAVAVAAALVLGCFAACSRPDETEKTAYYTVTFDLDGGTVDGRDLSNGVKVESGTKLALENYRPEKAGHAFGGWTSGGTEYAENDVITVNSDIALKAKWEFIPAEEFTVTFDPAGGILNGSAAVLEEVFEKNAVFDFSDYVPERGGYMFKGWNAGGEIFKDGTHTVTGDADFAAVWTKIPSADENFVFEETEEKDGYIIKDIAANSKITEIVAPGYYQNKPVLKIADNAFGYDDKIVSVDLSNCEKLEEIGYHNFSSCALLESVNLEGCSSLKKIGDGCFQGDAFKEINLKGLLHLEEIGGSSFRGSNGAIMGKNPVKELDFSDCVSLEKIGQQCFWYMTEIKELDFSNTKISDFGYKTVMSCPKLEKIALPATLNLTAGCSETFSDCANIKEISLDPLNIFMTVENGALMNADRTVIYKYAVKSEAEKYIAPPTLETVMACAFYGAANLAEIDLTAARPAAINYNAFAGCSNAVIKMPFGQDGTYADGGTCACGNKWNEGVKETVYGEAAKAFKFTTSLTDGASVTRESITFTASAQYGPSYALEPCNLTVKVNGAQIPGDNGSYTATLQDGENTIELIAEHDGLTETKTYKVNKIGAPALECSLDKEGVNSSAEASYSFTVKVKSAGEYLNISPDDVKVEIDCGYSSSFQVPGTGLAKAQTDGKTVTVTFDYEAMLMWEFKVDKQFNCRITVNTGGLNVSAEFKMIYEG